MNRLILLTGIIALSVFSGCSSLRIVRAATDSSADFQTYRTFQFLDVDFANERKFVLSDKVLAALKKYVELELNKQGITKSNNPDLYINIGVTVDTVQTTRETDYRDARTGYIGQRNYSWKSEEVVVGEYQEGTVVVEVLERSSNKQVWECAVARTIKGNGEKLEERIQEAIELAFTRYPSN